MQFDLNSQTSKEDHQPAKSSSKEVTQGLLHLKLKSLYPGNTRLAQLHRRISKFGERPAYLCRIGSNSGKMYPYLRGEEVAICACCQVKICVRNLPLGMATQPQHVQTGHQKYKLSSDITMFFFFIKMSIYYLLLRFLVTDSYNIYSSMHGHYCSDNPSKCADLFNSYLSGYNKHTPEDTPQLEVMNLLSIVMTLLSLLFFLYNRKVQYNLFEMLDQTDITQDDFSILVENIPQIIPSNSPLSCEYELFLQNMVNQKLNKWIKEGDAAQDDLLCELLRARWIEKLKEDRKDNMEMNIRESFKNIDTEKTILHDVDPRSKIARNSLRKMYSYDINDNDRDTYQQKYREFFMEKYERELEESILNDINGKEYPKELEHLPNVASISLCYDLTEIENLNRSRDHFIKTFIEDKEVSDFLVEELNKDVDQVERTRTVLDKTDEINELDYIDTFRANILDKIKSGNYTPLEVTYLNKIHQYFRILDEFHQLSIQLNERFSHDRSSLFNQTKFVGKAFITFQYQHMRQFFIRQSSANPSFLQVKGEPLKITQPPQPGDIFWYNLKISHQERNQSILFSVLVLLMCIGFSFVCVIFIEQKQLDSTETGSSQQLDITQKMVSNAYNAGMSLITVIINAILSYIIQHLTDLERHKTETKRIASLVIKNVVAQFLNTCVIYYTLDKLNEDVLPLEENGLLSKIMFLVGIGALITILVNILNASSLINYYLASFLGKLKYKEDKRYVNQIQGKLNKERELPEFCFVTQYTFYLVQLYVVTFYSFIAPVTVIFITAAFTVQYWVDKYNLFRKCSVSVTLNFELFKLIILLFQFSLLIDVVGNTMFEDMINTNPANQTTNIITLLLVSGYLAVMIFAPNFVKRQLLKKDVNYEFSYHRYIEDNGMRKAYWSDNPATSLADRRHSHIYNTKEETIQPKINFLTSSTQISKYSDLSEDSFYVERYTTSDVKIYHQYFD